MSLGYATWQEMSGIAVSLDKFFEKEVGHMPFGQSRDERIIQALQDMFAEQSRQLNSQGQLLATQTQRMDSIGTQITNLSAQQEALRNDFNARWQDLPKLYVPRQEHQAMALDARTVALEEFRMAATKDISDVKLNMQQQIQTAIATASKEIAEAKINAKDEINQTRKTLDTRQITLLVSAITVSASLVIEVILKLIFH